MDGMTPKSNGATGSATLSIASIINYRSEAFAQVRYHADRLAQISNAIEQLDAALMTVSQDNSASEQQALVSSGRSLVAVLGGMENITVAPGYVIEVHTFGTQVGSAAIRPVADFIKDWQAERLPSFRSEEYRGVYFGIVHEKGAFLQPLAMDGGK